MKKTYICPICDGTQKISSEHFSFDTITGNNTKQNIIEQDCECVHNDKLQEELAQIDYELHIDAKMIDVDEIDGLIVWMGQDRHWDKYEELKVKKNINYTFEN